jgi:ankyrin repeat protein
VKVAVGLGFDVNARNAAGDTPLHLAALHGFDAIVSFLAENGATLETKNKAGKTPLALTAPRVEAIGGATIERASTGQLLRKLGARE